MSSQRKYSVLTYLFGNYEKIREVKEKDSDAEYILVTDRNDLVSGTWNVVVHKFPDSYNDFDKVLYVRYHPFEFVSNDICIKVDHSVSIVKSLNGIVSKFVNGGYDMALMIHPERNRIDEEYVKWVETRRYPKEQAVRAISIINGIGYDFFYKGLYQLTLSIQRNDNITKSVNELTWSLNKLIGGEHQERVDQITFSVVLNKYFSYLNVMPISENLITDGKYMRWYHHGSNIPIPMKTNVIDPCLFDKNIEVIKF